ncbi:glycoside hydrolase family 108 protein [Spiribacter halobius]|uniref:Peptidoglycan-binding protein n=1 Tax=Sediminicurvatus halobius TaxID=2182432 RepID=A0A2U2N1I0_9GAMM|nr:glycosyl hydrolase 108 family protein [Spiribacter halobius]PWG62839.1 peptidoglycan-binding protein [Spiribacter halobius]UEX77011.1 peptidoglycan-binding protein [Spiribacter halobius]
MSRLPDTPWEWIRTAEGGEVDDPADRGGHTVYGISQRAYPDLDLDTLTEADARALYERDYWRAARCHELPAGVGVAHFDAAVNHGVGSACRQLQRAAGATVDGIIGPRTLAAVEAWPERVLVVELLGRRALKYHGIVVADSSQERFLRGWFNRLLRLQAFLYTGEVPA